MRAHEASRGAVPWHLVTSIRHRSRAIQRSLWYGSEVAGTQKIDIRRLARCVRGTYRRCGLHEERPPQITAREVHSSPAYTVVSGPAFPSAPSEGLCLDPSRKELKADGEARDCVDASARTYRFQEVVPEGRVPRHLCRTLSGKTGTNTTVMARRRLSPVMIANASPLSS